MEEIKERIWKEFVKTGDPGFYMLYKAMGGSETKNDGV